MYWDKIKIFVVDFFCLINGSSLGWRFAFCLLTHFIWNCIYVTLTQAFYAWQRATYLGLSFLTGASQIHEVKIGSDLSIEEKPSDRSILQGRRNQGEPEKIICCLNNKHGINHCPMSFYHHIIITSYLVLLHISKTLIHHCCVATSAKMTVGKRFPAK